MVHTVPGHSGLLCGPFLFDLYGGNAVLYDHMNMLVICL
jgi:hypothetical protein